jgi:hypothetical protein
VVGGDEEQVVLAEGGEQGGQRGVEGPQRGREAGGVVPVPE